MSDTEKNTEEENSTFKVSDRRKFSSDGELRETTDEKEVNEPHESPAEPEGTREPHREEQPPEASDRSAEQIDFASFVLSLATTALAHLGEVPDPATGETTENLVAAKQMIDILSILEQKTKGNLLPDEDRLLENLLYELRMKYLNKAKIITV